MARVPQPRAPAEHTPQRRQGTEPQHDVERLDRAVRESPNEERHEDQRDERVPAPEDPVESHSSLYRYHDFIAGDDDQMSIGGVPEVTTLAVGRARLDACAPGAC